MELKANAFAGYIFTAEELMRAASFNSDQAAYLQTIMSDAATEKINLEPDPKNFMLYLQKEAYLRGQIDIMQYLLDGTPVQDVVGKSPTSEKAGSGGIDWQQWQESDAANNKRST